MTVNRLSKIVSISTKFHQIIKIKGIDINTHDVIKTLIIMWKWIVSLEVSIIVDDKTKSKCNETGYDQTKKIMSVAILKKVHFTKYLVYFILISLNVLVDYKRYLTYIRIFHL